MTTKNNMPDLSEHFSPQQTDLVEVEVNVDRYMAALKHLEGKVVLELGCGAGLGTYLYSLVAKKVYAVDYDKRAIEEASRFPFPPGKVEFLHLDLEDPDTMARLPQADICVALEVLEHLEEPAAVLRELKTAELVFSVPLHSLEVSRWHKYRIDTERDVRALIQPFYDARYYEQTHKEAGGVWIHGHGARIIQ